MGKTALFAAVLETLVCTVLLHFNRDMPVIDWPTFVAHGEHLLDNRLDYKQILGPMGYAMYPAGHVWIYAGLSYLKINYSYHYSRILMAVLHIL